MMWAAIRDEGAIERVGYDAVARLASAGIPGYAVVSGRAVLEASLRDQANDAARHLLRPRSNRDTARQP